MRRLRGNERWPREGQWETFDIKPELKSQVSPGSLVTEVYNIDGIDMLIDLVAFLGIDISSIDDSGIRRRVHSTCPKCTTYCGSWDIPFHIAHVRLAGPCDQAMDTIDFVCPNRSCYWHFRVAIMNPIIASH